MGAKPTWCLGGRRLFLHQTDLPLWMPSSSNSQQPPQTLWTQHVQGQTSQLQKAKSMHTMCPFGTGRVQARSWLHSWRWQCQHQLEQVTDFCTSSRLDGCTNRAGQNLKPQQKPKQTYIKPISNLSLLIIKKCSMIHLHESALCSV